MGYGSEKTNASEIQKIWERFVPVEKSILGIQSQLEELNNKIQLLDEKTQSPSESQIQAQTAARSATTFRTNVRKIKEEVEEISNDIKSKFEYIERSNSEIIDALNFIKTTKFEVESNYEELLSALNKSKEKEEELESFLEILNNLFEKAEEVRQDIENSNLQASEIAEFHSKSQGILRNITSFHSKIKELRDEIIGYSNEDNEGNVEYISGMKDELEDTYDELSQNYSELKQEWDNHKKLSSEEFQKIKEDTSESIEEMFKTYSAGYDEIYSRINKLLPNALTAGLSSAYDAKITLETSELSGHKKNFGRAIATLVIISLIPFGVDIYLLAALEKDLISVISDTPKLLLSILPLYLPVLWIAYSANKKSNLSKRLIEEYTHKGVLSKTFEGLSGQIKEIDDVGLSEELRAKLLFNLLQVNTENPGKLISDYKTTDHPVMDALDKSIKLSDSLDKLKNIPGLTKLIAKLEKEREIKLSETSKKVSNGLNTSEIIANGAKNSVKDIATESEVA